MIPVTDLPIAPTNGDQLPESKPRLATQTSESGLPPDGSVPDEATPEATSQPTGVPAKRSRRILEWVAVVLIAVLVAGGLRTFVVQSFFVPSGSMLPTLQLGDRHHGHEGRLHDSPRRHRRVPSHPSRHQYHRCRPCQRGSSGCRERPSRLAAQPCSSTASRSPSHGCPRLIGKCAEAAEDIPTTKIAPHHYFMMGDCHGYSDDSQHGHGAVLQHTLSVEVSLSSCALRASVPSLVCSRFDVISQAKRAP